MRAFPRAEMTFLSALLPPRRISTVNATFCFASLPVQVVPGSERRAACGKLRLFGETLDEQVRCRRDCRIRLRGDFALLVLWLVGVHCSRLGRAMRVSKVRTERLNRRSL